MAKQLSPGAKKYLVSELGNTEGEIGSLDLHIASLTDKREGLVWKAEMLREKLGIGSGPLPALADIASPSGAKTSGRAHQTTKPPLRKLIIDVLKKGAGGMKPRDVQIALGSMGHKYDGVRISTDLWRMNKAGKVEKREGLYFAPEG